MNITEPFVRRPVATTLLSLAVALTGGVAFGLLPVSPLPQVDFPTVSVQASLPGASPEVMAATVATPLERAMGRIAGISELTSNSTLGSSRVTVQFDLSRKIDDAARDVQGAIQAARSLLPTSLPSNPTYRKVNPADAPVMVLAMTSDHYSRGQLYDMASTNIAQRISQMKGVGQVTVGGGSLPAVRVELNPTLLNKLSIGFDDVQRSIQYTNANRPKGFLDDGEHSWTVMANDQAKVAEEYKPIVVAWRHGAAVRLGDLGDVVDSVTDLRNYGMANGKPAVLLIIFRQPNANIIEVVDAITALMPEMQSTLPASVDIKVMIERTSTIRAALRDVERTLLISVALVILVVYLFLRSGRATLIPAVAIPISLVGTFAAMYMLGFSLNNLSLMALIVATGFVVDDAIVVLENVSRHIEAGMEPFEAALTGAREVAFTVVSMSISLVAVFIPILFMGGIVGRLFREFAVTLSVAIGISLIVSLSTTPMMCSRLLKDAAHQSQGRLARWSERAFNAMHRGYERSLDWTLKVPWLMVLVFAATVLLNIYMYSAIPKGFFPQQDTGRLIGFVRADQSISFQAMRQKLDRLAAIVMADPAVENVTAFTGGGQRNSAQMFIALKPLKQRHASLDQILGRLRPKLMNEPGANLFLNPIQDIRAGGRSSDASNQFTLRADDLTELRTWAPKLEAALRDVPELTDVSSDQQDKGLQMTLTIDRPTAARMGITPRAIDTALNLAFGQAQVSVIYQDANQYRVVEEAAPEWWQNPKTLDQIFVLSPSKGQVPLSAFSRYEPTLAPLAVSHQGQFAAATISFNLPAGVSMSTASGVIQDTMTRIGVPKTIYASFEGTAKLFQQGLDNQPYLILAALLTVYIVLGILYESLVHPITILSTLPSAGVGALLALRLFNTEFTLIALIGVILLIGIVKKNAILMIDFALQREREGHLDTKAAIREAALLRFRPIMMTTMAAALGAIPLALGSGDGAELRTPLGISIVGGLAVSQVLTLYTTPAIYIYLDRFRLWTRRQFHLGDEQFVPAGD
ncbi:MAG: multidrug efflux RND transporter permease subunit [Usitatibacter sp.]